MPVTARTSGKQAAIKKSRTSRKRRENQNVVINELASLVPLSTPLVSCDSSSGSLVPSSGNKPPTISVLRLTTSYIKLHNFIQTISPDCSSSGEFVGRMEEAIDGFLIILDKDANILYVSESIAGHVGLLQQDVIGQNLTDITLPEFSSKIADSLKPALVQTSTVNEECVISQHKQFYVRFIPSVYYSTSPIHAIYEVSGNLKVKLMPLKACGNDVMEFVEPTAIGFVGECRVVESVVSILEISIPCSSFIVTRSLDMKLLSVDASVKNVTGYDPELTLSEKFNAGDFIHPADSTVFATMEGSLMQSGHAVSPHFRFLTSSGDWVWMQMEGTLRYKNGKIPHYWEVKIRALSLWRSRLECTEQKEAYSTESVEEIPSADKESDIGKKRPNHTADSSRIEEAKRMVDSLETMVQQIKKTAVGYGDQFVLKENDTRSLVAASTAKVAHHATTTQPGSITKTIACQTSPLSSPFDAHSNANSPLSIPTNASSVSEDITSQTTWASDVAPNTNFSNERFFNLPPTDQIPLPVVSSGTFSPDSSIMSTGQQALSPGQHFPSFTNPTNSCSPLLETSLVSGNSAARVTQRLSCNFSPQSGASLESAMSADSIPSVSSVSFSNSDQTLDSLPQTLQNSIFNPQIPSSFTFSDNASTSSSYQTQYTDPMQSCNIFPTQFLYRPLPEAHNLFDNSNHYLINSSDPLMQQLTGEMMGCSNFMYSATCDSNESKDRVNCRYNFLQNMTSPKPSCTKDSMPYVQTHLIPCDDKLRSDLSPNISNTNHELQDILQQFI